MPRTVKEEEYAVKRKEILDVAHRLVYTKGYEQMSIQDILNELQISKGAFYHYFDSKQAMLEALIELIYYEAEQILIPIVREPLLPALEKLQRYFDTGVRWKTDRKSFFLSLVRVWYADENAIVRQKVQAKMVKQATPLLTEIICQGVEEGVLTTPFPDQIGAIIFPILLGLGDAFTELLFSSEPKPDVLRQAECLVMAHNDALERVLGAPAGSLNLVDTETLKEWFVSPNGKV